MKSLGEVLKGVISDLEAKKRKAAESLACGFEVYIGTKVGCGDPEACIDCMNNHNGLCPVKESLLDAFMAGASCFMIGIEEAGKSGVQGAITQRMEKLSKEIENFGKGKLRDQIKGFFSQT